MKEYLAINLAKFYITSKLSIFDAVVLDFFRDMTANRNSEIIRRIEDNKEWILIDKNIISNFLPYLQLKTETSINIILKRLKKAGFIEVNAELNTENVNLYFRLLKKTDELFSFQETITENKIMFEKKSKNIDENEKIETIFKIYEEKVLPGSRLTDKAKNKISARLKEFTVEEILQGIDNFSKDIWWMENNARRGVAWFFHSEDRTEQFKNIIPRQKTIEKEILKRGSFG